MKHDRLLRIAEVLEMIGVSAATLWRWEKLGQFPRRVKIGNWSVAWRESEIQQWMRRLPPAGE